MVLRGTTRSKSSVALPSDLIHTLPLPQIHTQAKRFFVLTSNGNFVPDFLLDVLTEVDVVLRSRAPQQAALPPFPLLSSTCTCTHLTKYSLHMPQILYDPYLGSISCLMNSKVPLRPSYRFCMVLRGTTRSKSSVALQSDLIHTLPLPQIHTQAKRFLCLPVMGMLSLIFCWMC
jgi:hypothetical protein